MPEIGWGYYMRDVKNVLTLTDFLLGDDVVQKLVEFLYQRWLAENLIATGCKSNVVEIGRVRCHRDNRDMLEFGVSANLTSCVDTVKYRHCYIRKDQIRQMFLGFLYCD